MEGGVGPAAMECALGEARSMKDKGGGGVEVKGMAVLSGGMRSGEGMVEAGGGVSTVAVALAAGDWRIWGVGRFGGVSGTEVGAEVWGSWYRRGLGRRVETGLGSMCERVML